MSIKTSNNKQRTKEQLKTNERNAQRIRVLRMYYNCKFTEKTLQLTHFQAVTENYLKSLKNSTLSSIPDD